MQLLFWFLNKSWLVNSNLLNKIFLHFLKSLTLLLSMLLNLCSSNFFLTVNVKCKLTYTEKHFLIFHCNFVYLCSTLQSFSYRCASLNENLNNKIILILSSLLTRVIFILGFRPCCKWRLCYRFGYWATSWCCSKQKLQNYTAGIIWEFLK